MQCKKEDTIRCGVVFCLYCGVCTQHGNKPWRADKEPDTKTVLQLEASIPKVVSALVLTVYVIGVFTLRPNFFYSVNLKYSLCPEFWCESWHYRWWLGDFRTKKEHNYCHLFSRSCYWQPTLFIKVVCQTNQQIFIFYFTTLSNVLLCIVSLCLNPRTLLALWMRNKC